MRIAPALAIALVCLPAWGAGKVQEGRPTECSAREEYAIQRQAADRGAPEALLWCLRHGTAEQQSPAVEREMYAVLIEAARAEDNAARLGQSLLVLIGREASPAGLGRVPAARLYADLRKSSPVRSVRSATLLAEARLTAPAGSNDRTARKRARALLDELLERYPEARERREAKDVRWRLEHLSIGCLAPDFLAHDVDGNELRIRDYRDRVSVVRFFDFRDTKSSKLIQQDLHMSERFWDERFALIGIARDSDTSHFRRMREEWGLTWDTAFEREGVASASDAWRIDAWPQAVVLDAAGVVRAVGLEGEALQERVAALLREQNEASAVPAPSKQPLDGRREKRR